MRKYIDAELLIVRLGNDVIATSVPAMGAAYTTGDHSARIGGRRDMFDDSYDEF